VGLKIIILAAGKGKRMTSTLPKVMHSIGGKPMLEHVVNTARTLNPDNIYVIYGNGGSRIKDDMAYLNVDWVEQHEQLGTGHAVLQALPYCDEKDQVLVLYGDVPLTSTRLLKQLLQDTPPHGLGLVVTELKTPDGFGRIIRNDVGNIVAIVEHKDAVDWQLQIKEINTGILTASASYLKQQLPQLKNNNTQAEYYLTDTVSIAVAEGIPVGGVLAHEPEEVLGVNDRWQQVKLERYYQYTQAKKLSLTGVHIADFNRLDIRGEVKIGLDSFIDINVVLEGNVSIGNNCTIGPNVKISNSRIGDGVKILSGSVVDGAIIADNVSVGPMAHLRPGTEISANAKVGNFVETKNTVIGEGSKANHLSYLGDAQLGKNVNVGAGTITCNYDGANKHRTEIHDGAFIGSNTSLVAPVKVGENATIGAGSTITSNVYKDQLVVERGMQKAKDNWQRPAKKDKTKVKQ
jgi:bifunctional UDP-N-acetylglucosamine pyrophosphorylase / glucosamine-1-phosphate N-acetyltransferase